MEDVEILRSLGTPPDILERYAELREKSRKTIKKEFFFVLTLLPIGIIFVILLKIGFMRYMLILIAFLYILPILILAAIVVYYFPISREKLEQIYMRVIKEHLLIWFHSEPIEADIEEKYFYVFAVEIALTFILWAYFTDTAIIALLSLFPLAALPFGRILSKKNQRTRLQN